MANPGLYYRSNVGGGVALLDAMRAAGVNRLVYSSTAAVYGEPRRVPIAEADRTEPINPYGATKLAFEGAMRWFAASHEFRAISLRYFNVAGATERNGEDHEPETHLIPLVLRVAADEATHVQIFGQDYPTPDGTCIRDFIHVRDLAAAHLLALEATGEGDSSFEVYNLGSAAGFSVREVVEAARKVTGRGIPARVVKRRDGRSAGARRLVPPGAPRARLAAAALEAGADAGRCVGLAPDPPDRLRPPAAHRRRPGRPLRVRRTRGAPGAATGGRRLGLAGRVVRSADSHLPRSPRLPETESPAAPRRSRAPRRATPPPSPATNGNAPADDPEASPLMAAVLAAQRSHRFGEIELPVTIARAIEKMGFTEPTEVQARAIGPLRAGKDLIGQAQTGTGKTAAFGIPIVEKVDPNAHSRPGARPHPDARAVRAGDRGGRGASASSATSSRWPSMAARAWTAR